MFAFVDSVTQWLLGYRALVVPLFFVAFFVGTFAAAFLYRRRFVRQSYIAVFFACLLVVSLSPEGYEIRPIEDLHKFSSVAPEEKTNYLIYVEDSTGRELRFDRRVIPTVSPNDDVARALVDKCSPEESTAAGRYLLLRANEYRDGIERGSSSPLERITFPRHQRDFQWTADQLESFGPFVSLKVYKLHLTFAEGEYELRSTERELAFEVRIPANVTPSAYHYSFEDRCV